MDRNNLFANPGSTTLSLSARRAWIEIAVDSASGTLSESLSARRAWIEIWWLRCWQLAARVALRKESVDRNDFPIVPVELTTLSLSARRAWIEMFLSMGLDGRFKLSLSARRAWIEI